MKRVVITGVSTGIGHASAKVLLKQGFQVYTVVPNGLRNWIIPHLIARRTLDQLIARFMAINRKSWGRNVAPKN
jgi:NAD(P)-dependent dehydrogenase (short-subunit alcohol dehydrogenase family)